MQEFEFISPMGGTLIWVPGDTVQENLGSLSDEEYEGLKNELAPIFSRFTMILSGTLVVDEQDRSNMLRAYSEHFTLFVDIARLAIASNPHRGALDDFDDEEPSGE